VQKVPTFYAIVDKKYEKNAVANDKWFFATALLWHYSFEIT
jgi:hypothetical protein